ncbi:MAG: TAXI family TRAP transporter solute-binding subunit, partial [Kineosporiaceae bacterium]
AAAVDTGVLTRELTGIARVYDSLIQLVVPADSPITSLLDLEGRAVSVGTNGSGSEFTTTSMLTTAGITPKKIEHFGQNPAVAALKSGELDAFFSVTGSPTPSIAKLAKEMAIRLIPLGEYYPMLERAIPHVYTYDTIAAGAYQGVAETPTVRVPNALLVRQGLEDHVVAKVTEAVLSDSSRQYWKHEVSKNIDRKLAAVLGSVQMHPAARAWLDSN